MSPRKLSDTDRVEILDLYRTSEETTSTLATRYGVSSSTISRFLKNNLSESEYEDLIQEKRLARTGNPHGVNNPKSQPLPNSDQNKTDSQTQANQQLPVTEESKSPSIIKVKTAQDEDLSPAESQPDSDSNLDHLDTEESHNFELESEVKSISTTKDDPEIDQENAPVIYLDEDSDLESINIIQEMFGEDIDDEDDFEEDDDDEEDDWDEDDQLSTKEINSSNEVQVLPLSQASFPNTCYLVIDRSAELITRPLKDFADLGNIPSEEVLQKTLPIFDNHRVAKRFSNRRGKVIKVPDGRILQKTSDHLCAKGITRLLMDGKIYSL